MDVATITREAARAAVTGAQAEPTFVAARLGAARPSAPERIARPRLPWLRITLQAAGVWLVMRVAYAVALAVFVPLFVGDSIMRGGLFGLTDVTHATGVSFDTLVALFGRWDAAIYYVPIAVQGYRRPIDAGFWPFYPILIHLATLLTGTRYALLDALVIGNLGSLLAYVGVSALVAQLARERGAVASEIAQRRALALLCAMPFAFWLVMPYTDGLFLGFVACAFVAMRRERWLWVGLWAVLAALTRPTAVALLFPLLWEIGLRLWRRWQASRQGITGPLRLADVVRAGWHPLVALLSGPVALGGWLLYCQQRFHNAFAPYSAEQIGFGHNATPWESGPLAAITLMVSDLRSPTAPLLSWNQVRLWLDAAPPLLVGIIVALCLAASLRDVWLGRRHDGAGLPDSSRWRLFLLPTSLLIYALAIWLMAISEPVTGTITPDPLPSTGRYLLAAAPLYVVWARLCARWPWLEQAAWQVGLPLQLLLALYVFAGGWLV